MAVVILHLIILATFVHFVTAQQTNGSVSVGASLIATPDAKPWVSSSGEFAFGFQQVQGSDNFLLSIWYDKIPDKTIVWFPKDGPMVATGSKVELLDSRGLVLSDPQSKEVWTSGSISDVAYGVMNDTGNFVVVGNDSRNIWESFNFPGDTLLPTQVIEREEIINSRMSKSNFSGGRFQLRLIPDGNLVLNTRDMFTSSPLDAYYISGTRDPLNFTNSGFRLIFDATGYLYILRRNGERSNLTSRDMLPSGDNYFRATLDSDGVFTQYYHPKDPAANTDWRVIWFEPENICNRLDGSVGGGACGLNNVCSLDNNRPNCECPQGFSLVDSNDPNGNCNPDFTPSCGDGYVENQFDFIELTDIDWPNADFEHINPTNEESCKKSCLKDCFCAVATFSNKQCWKKILPLFNGKKDPSINVKAFLKFKKGQNTQNPRYSGENKSKRSLIYVGPVLLSTFALIIIVLIGALCAGFFQIHKKKKTRTQYPRGRAFETSLPRFTYQELVIATNGFKDELGKGAFGIVYKGSIGTKIVAVKKLERVFQDCEKEFQTEVNAIARTHHKNLVQLVGYCNDGEKRLLIYEYMSNNTLAEFLFGNIRPSWKQRSNIAIGIAKGLSYLHEECSTQVIHCDIKPQNILLDEYYDAKISDFGLAKLLKINQSGTYTGIRGTKGYVSPEWFRNMPVTVKVDVYSFGVLLLEIISCRKSLHFESGDENIAVLTDSAWDCYQEGRLDVFVENDLEALEDRQRLKAFFMVALWCVQETPSERPTMRKVIQMLEGAVEVTKPPCPFSVSVTSV
uniref:Receptor-like serine/threonine-protein kinase n=1 Tax=Tanacetum cinerariifolium TaxID=118510 RepID=A0A699GNY4_TANCI|nr:G-type lectin S-receptor-like serine/threonine-protein kinase LECRK3 [Tanacetum cinerariifolium]